jgi:hypothetical protein
MLSPTSRAALDAFDTSVGRSPEPSPYHPLHRPRLVRLVMRLLQDGEAVFPQDVTVWATDRRWSEHDPRDLGELVMTASLVLEELQLPP